PALPIFAGAVDTRGVDLEPPLRRAAPHKGRTTDIGHRLDGFTGGQAMGDLDHRALGIAVQQQVGLGVHENRMAYLVLPVVIVGNPPQRSLDATDDDRHALVSLSATL